MQDRAISYIHPDFVIRKGEMYHKRRYPNVISLSAYFYGEHITEAEKETARGILAANADNYDGLVKNVCFYRTAEELENCLMRIALINESPKAKQSTSASILTDLKIALSENAEIIQAEPALKVLENWCVKAGFLWSGGIGIGGGGALAQMPHVKNGHGPKAPVAKALRALADSILQNEAQKNHYVSIAFPRFLYKLAAQMGWRQMVKQNGGRARDLGKRWE